MSSATTVNAKDIWHETVRRLDKDAREDVGIRMINDTEAMEDIEDPEDTETDIEEDVDAEEEDVDVAMDTEETGE